MLFDQLSFLQHLLMSGFRQKLKTSSSESGSTSTLNYEFPEAKSAFPSNPTIFNLSNNPSNTPHRNSSLNTQLDAQIRQKPSLKLLFRPTTATPFNSDALSRKIKKSHLTEIVGQKWKQLKNMRRTSSSNLFNFVRQSQIGHYRLHSNENFVTAPSSPSSDTITEEPSPVFLEAQLYSSSPDENQLQTSQRISYESSYTAIEYTELVRNSIGSDLSFRCRGLFSPNEDDHEWLSEPSCDLDQLRLQLESNGCLYCLQGKCQVLGDGLRRGADEDSLMNTCTKT